MLKATADSASPPREARPLPARSGRSWRVFAFFSCAILLTGIGSLLFADLLWRFGWSASRIVLLILFAILLLLISIGCVDAVYGFVLRRGRASAGTAGLHALRDIANTSTALLFPVFNEDAKRVCEGLRTAYESLARAGHIERFDFFILSDSTVASKWIDEERCWFDLVRELDALGRIFYRRRLVNEGKKSGNIRDFLRAWGKRYRYFIVFDADSVMSGATVVELVRMMECNPAAGLIQTAPALVNARTAFGRMQQFANRLYGPIFFAGLDYWAQDGSNYWGHNAIIRTEPFMQVCDLPKLPGKKPFGGQILSHDFVEAALLRKENFEVWFAWDLEGSYEEAPTGIIANAQRDRRWCQGNLQHAMLLFARGFRGISRIHLALGILSYAAAPLWLLFLLTGTYELWIKKQAGLSDIVVAAFTPFIRFGAGMHALLVFGLAMTLIFFPKLLSVIDLALDPKQRRAFGGLARTIAGTCTETLFSTLHAPVQMLFHTKFIVATLFGFDVGWGAQDRSAETTWAAAWRQQWGQTAIGIGWGALIWWLDPRAFWWFLPVAGGLSLSVPLSVFTSRRAVGDALRRAGIFVTPEETAPPDEIIRLNERMREQQREPRSTPDALCDAVLDPYMNAIHVSLLPEQQARLRGDSETSSAPFTDRRQLQSLAEKLLREGVAALDPAAQTILLADPNAMTWLHHEAWSRPSNELAAQWREAIEKYNEP